MLNNERSKYYQDKINKIGQDFEDIHKELIRENGFKGNFRRTGYFSGSLAIIKIKQIKWYHNLFNLKKWKIYG